MSTIQKMGEVLHSFLAHLFLVWWTRTTNMYTTYRHFHPLNGFLPRDVLFRGRHPSFQGPDLVRHVVLGLQGFYVLLYVFLYMHISKKNQQHRKKVSFDHIRHCIQNMQYTSNNYMFRLHSTFQVIRACSECTTSTTNMTTQTTYRMPACTIISHVKAPKAVSTDGTSASTA